MYAGIINDLQIIWFSNILTWSIPDEGYSRNVSCTLNLISKGFFFYVRSYVHCLYLSCIICLFPTAVCPDGFCLNGGVCTAGTTNGASCK